MTAGSTLDHPSAPARFLYDDLLQEAERVRWRMDDFAWGQIDHSAVDDALIHAVTTAVFAELTTYTATERFMAAFVDDVDFSQWISIWFYEETKHPSALMRWLRLVGTEIDTDALRTQRGTFPFAPHPLTTLALNVIAEMQAADSYLSLAKFSSEPVLSDICTKIARDEARHASHFFRYAKHLFSISEDRDRQGRRVLTVLATWLTAQNRLRHPGQIAVTTAPRMSSEETKQQVAPGSLQERVCAAVGAIVAEGNMRTLQDVRGSLVRMRARSVENA
jgi:hypothetical protein